MGETVAGSLVPEWADLDPSVLGEPVKSIEVSVIMAATQLNKLTCIMFAYH